MRSLILPLLLCVACQSTETDETPDPATMAAEAAAWVPPAPQAEHQWLQQLVGEWKSSLEMPGAQPLQGTENIRTLGGFWVLSDVRGTMPNGQPMTAIMTLGFDPRKKKYVGSWVDSVTSHMWKYEGKLDATGKILTLESKGPDFENPEKDCRFRDVIQVHDKDHKSLTSLMKDAEGNWVEMMKVQCTRTR